MAIAKKLTELFHSTKRNHPLSKRRSIEYNEQSMSSKKEDFVWTLKDDYAFKRLLGVEENKPILQDFLECVLNLEHEEIIGLELLDKELKKDHAEDRTGILDIQVRLKNGTLIDIEIQRSWNRLFPKRSFAYLSKMYSSTLQAGQLFSYSKKCIGINIIVWGSNLNDEMHSVSLFRMQEDKDKVLTDAITMHFLNLEKVRNLPVYKAKTKAEHLINWTKMIDAEKKEDRAMLARTSPIFKLLNEKIEEITRTPEEERLFDSRMKMRSDILGEMELNYNEGFEKGRKEGIEKGIEKGSYNNKLETVKKAQGMGLPIEAIIELTGLTEAEILKLK